MNSKKTALQNKLTLNSYSANGKQTADWTSDFITFYAVLREAARVFRESKISNEKSNFFYFTKTSLSVN